MKSGKPKGAPFDDEKEDIVQRYWQGSLMPEEEARFEELFLESPELVAELETEGRFRRGFKDMAAEDAARAAADLAVELGVLATLARLLRRPSFAGLAAVLLAAVLLPSILLMTRGPEPAEAPLTGIPLFSLTAPRDAGDPPLEVTPREGWLSLAVPVEDDPRFGSFQVTIKREGAEVFRRADLEPNALGVILLTFPDGFLAHGEHRLLLEGLTVPAGDAELLGTYAFTFRRP